MTIKPEPVTLHASCVAIDQCAVLLLGVSGSGKSDLALRLIDRGAQLVSDDITLLEPRGGRLLAFAPPTIRGKLEVRGLGIVEVEQVDGVTVCLAVELDREQERFPFEPRHLTFASVQVPAIALDSRAASAPIKVELELRQMKVK